ncbi:MAG: hypothetical protein ACRDNE_13220 [Gaiellaceae bacterium]
MSERTRLWLAGLVPLGALASAAGLAAARWPRYWEWVALEESPMRFLQALLLFGAALLAALLALLAVLDARPPAERRTWLCAAVGLSYLMLDERFALHERVRDNALAGLGLGLPWGSPGDYLLVAYLGAALLFLPRLLRLLRLLREEPAALRFFAAGALLAASAVSADTLDVERMSPATERLEQTLEEVVEAVSASLLAAALFLVLYGRLAERRTVSASWG